MSRLRFRSVNYNIFQQLNKLISNCSLLWSGSLVPKLKVIIYYFHGRTNETQITIVIWEMYFG